MIAFHNYTPREIRMHVADRRDGCTESLFTIAAYSYYEVPQESHAAVSPLTIVIQAVGKNQDRLLKPKKKHKKQKLLD